MRIAIGTDHRGFAHKEYIKHLLTDIDWIDVGCFSTERCDYPPFAKLVVQKLLQGEVDAGILLCGSGIGMSIAANRYAGVYAGLVWNTCVARMAKEDDNVNVLVFPTDFLTPQDAVDCARAWLRATFKEGHYQERLVQIDEE